MGNQNNDIHGISRLSRNVFVSWCSQCVLIVSGFIIPRFIDNNLGPSSLGVWDFSWSLVSHFTLIQGGITGSVNRYVAKYRSSNDTRQLNISVSSVAGILRIMGLCVVVLTVLCVYLMPTLIRDGAEDYLFETRWVVGLLGLSLAIQMSSSVYGGIITGSHRWDLHNGVYIATYIAIFIGMLASLTLGYGLIGLAVVSLIGETCGRIARRFIAYRVCLDLEIRMSLFKWYQAKMMIVFGGKLFLKNLAQLISTSTASVLILSFLGPAALALYTRPIALCRHVDTLLHKYSLVLVPSTSSIENETEIHKIRNLTLNATQFGAAFALPPLLFLAFLGGDVLQLWMGDGYANTNLIRALALVQLISIAHTPMYYILVGTNRHGSIGPWAFAASAIGLTICFGILSLGIEDLATCAIVLTCPWALVSLLVMPGLLRNLLKLSYLKIIIKTWSTPILACLPLVIMLFLVNSLQQITFINRLLWGSVLSVFCILIPYWFWLVPPTWKSKFIGRTRALFSSAK